jgi:hypothetical protein
MLIVNRFTRDPKLRDLPFQSMPEKCRRHLIFGTKSIARIFLPSKKNPERKVRRRRKGHVRLRYIVWGSSLVMEKRAMVRF